MLASLDKEIYIGIRWNFEEDRYSFYTPEQKKEAAHIEYQCGESIVLDLHSHPGPMGAFFSGTDNKDEQGLRIYGVIGHLEHPRPVLKLRAGVYGYYSDIKWNDIFDGHLVGCNEGEINAISAEKN